MTDTRTLPEIAEVEIDTPRLADVKGLWRANRRYLGFLPEGGFIDRALKGTLLVAIRGDTTLGYVLYDLPRDRVKIVHLCVALEARGTRIDVEFRYLGPREDPETVELELLARLQQLGYQVERRAPEDEPRG